MDDLHCHNHTEYVTYISLFEVYVRNSNRTYFSASAHGQMVELIPFAVIVGIGMSGVFLVIEVSYLKKREIRTFPRKDNLE
jgi:hypothetical protein